MAQEGHRPALSIFESATELCEEVSASITGKIPPWLKGTLLRNGPGKFEFGTSSYNHWFDGQALLHRFTISQGSVTYFNKFVRSESFCLNSKKDSILCTEFGTNAKPDPCQNIFARFFSYFTQQEKATDNCLVNVVELKEKLYVVSEHPKMFQIHPKSLDVLGTVNVTEEFPSGNATLYSSLAHPHKEKDGTTLNLSTTRGSNSIYHVTVVPPKSPEIADEKPLEGGKILCSVPAHSSLAYFHSFGMTDNYVILVENPLLINIPKILTRRLVGWSIADCFYWNPSQLSRFHIIAKKTGERVGIYTAKAMFTFHHINAYETESEIVIDLCGYEDATIIQVLYLHERRKSISGGCSFTAIPEARRYKIPLPLSQNLNPVPILVNPDEKDYEVLCPFLELPRLNYDQYNGKPYTFVYGVCSSEIKGYTDQLVKLNVNTKEVIIWGEEEMYASEPVFVPRPGSSEEDDGVVLSVVIGLNNKKTFLLVLDSKSFKEVGRAEVPFVTPASIHGTFIFD